MLGAIATRDRQGPRLAAQLLISPVTDFAFTSNSYEKTAKFPPTTGSM